jgi:hypothetical protein
MVIYNIFVLYVLSSSHPSGWAGMGDVMIIYFTMLPMFLLSIGYLSCFLWKNEYMNAIIP